MNKDKEIKKLKKQAKHWYLTYTNLFESYDCGKNLAEFINPEMYKAKNEFNQIIIQLREIDPSCPEASL